MLSESATDNERGSPRYFAPEMAAWQPSGRAADIFSLGCVLLELVILHFTGSLEHVRQNRSNDPSYHANLDKSIHGSTYLTLEALHGRIFSSARFELCSLKTQKIDQRPSLFSSAS